MSAVGIDLERQITQWREFIGSRRTISATDVDELESHLRDRIDALIASGLTEDEAFLIAVKRMGALDDLSKEYAREHSERLWKHLVVGADSPSTPQVHTLGIATLIAIVAALWVKLPALFGQGLESNFFITTMPVMFLLPLAVYLLIRRSSEVATWIATLAPFVVVGVVLLAFPFEEFGMTRPLAILHGAVLLWLAVGVAYTDGDVSSSPARMNFVRFTGEWLVYVLLILVGGVALSGIAAAAFEMVDIELFDVIAHWMAPCGTAAAIVIGAWLVEEKQSVIENILPVLTRLFTPLFALVLIALLGTAVLQWNLIDASRELLIVFDLVMIAAVALLLYTISARDTLKPAGWYEWVQLAMVVAALLVDVIVLGAMLARIGEFGVSANKLASLGVNLIMFANLAGAGWLQLKFIRAEVPFARLERWQTSFAPVYLGWATIVVLAFPPVFGFA